MDYERFMAEVRKREAEMRVLRKNGMTLLQIGNKYNITAERVRQILLRTPAKKTPSAARHEAHV
jgi:DNA-directed RNA polymerase sigma subunit (sigma70/sigma32)